MTFLVGLSAILRVVREGGVTIRDIVRAVTNVTDIMGEIASASGEQSKGIAQVGQAVAEIDSVTQQHVALVEQASAAALSLEEQAEVLNQTVAVFQLFESVVPVAAPVVAPVATLARAGSGTAAKKALPPGNDNWEQF